MIITFYIKERIIKEEMKKKIIPIMCVCASLLLCAPNSISAMTHNYSNCGAKQTVQKCGSYLTTSRDAHLLHTNTYCTRTAYIYSHYKACSGCGANNGEIGSKICSRSHQYCPTEQNLCK